MSRWPVSAVFTLLLVQAISVAGASIPEHKRVYVRQLRTFVGTPDDPMRMPTDVAVDSESRVYVADGVNDRIVVFNPDGTVNKHLREAAGRSLSRPTGITVDSEDQLWVADTGNMRIVAFSQSGSVLETIDLSTKDAKRPFDATDLVVSPDGRSLLIVDNENHRLARYDRSSGQVVSVGRRGTSLGEFQWPFMVAMDPSGRAFVTEAIGGRVQVVTPDNAFERPIARFGVELGQLYRPKGVAETGGRVYVSDSTTKVIQVFERNGRSVGVLTGRDGQPLRLDHPMGLAVRGNLLYAVELASDSVAVLELIDDVNVPTRAEEGGKP